MTEKYLIINPVTTGLSNVMMYLEMGFSIAHITGRTLIIPPGLFLDHITDNDSTQWPSMWDLFDKNNNTFNTIELNEHNELKDVKGTFCNFTITAQNIHQAYFSYRPDYYIPEFLPNNVTYSSNYCLVNNYSSVKDSVDFKNFAGTRKIIDFNSSEKYLYIPQEVILFQHFWYWVYPGGAEQRNELKNKINKLFKYSQRYYDTIKEKVSVGQYNAIHVRRADFVTEGHYQNAWESISTSKKLLTQLEKLLDPNIPLYIATDENNKDFFNEVAEVYKIFFIDRFFKDLSKLECAILEQIICSQAEQFEGTSPSTYTKRINIMRGLDGRWTRDYTGINEIKKYSSEMNSPLPWVGNTDENNNSRFWDWNMSSHPQWMQETIVE